MTKTPKTSFIPEITIGEVVDNVRIVDEFLCSPQGGMRRSKKKNCLVLVSKHVASSTKIYDDKVIDGVYHYTGQGLNGDQSLSFAQNKTLAESSTNKVALHLFEVFKNGQYIYVGMVKLAGKPYRDKQEDQAGNERIVWIFPLKLVDSENPSGYLDKELLNEVYEDQAKIAGKLDLSELRDRAIKSGSTASSRTTVSKTYIRNPLIAEYTKRLAKGLCQLCDSTAPFKDKHGEPYLESHHVVWLSKNGPDTVANTVALCPNCHKRMHVLNDDSDIQKLAKLKSIIL
jgi:5-methylcytosine-specific restriction protein A